MTMDPTSKLFPGMVGTESRVVTRDITVAHFHPEMPEVLGTPFMIYLMEVAASNAIWRYLPTGWISVGYEVYIKHTAPTPVGRTVIANARLESINGRMVTFSVEAHDGFGEIGTGKHVRALVQLSRFERNLGSR
jgi:predicted thioesterase